MTIAIDEDDDEARPRILSNTQILGYIARHWLAEPVRFGFIVALILTSAACAALMVRQHRRAPSPILMWSAACFTLLALSNLVVVIDQVLLGPETSLRPIRLLLTLGAVSVLLFGFIWEAEQE